MKRFVEFEMYESIDIHWIGNKCVNWRQNVDIAPIYLVKRGLETFNACSGIVEWMFLALYTDKFLIFLTFNKKNNNCYVIIS